jgi:penicillin-binding protein 2
MAVDKRAARLGVLATVSLILIGLLGARLWFLQGVQSDEYQAKVTASKNATVYIAPERGRIFDADGRVLADNKRILTVTVDWAVVKKEKDRRELFERLSGPLETPVDDLMRRYDPCYLEPKPCKKAQQFDRLLPLPLKEGVDEDKVAFIKERGEDYPGVDVTVQFKRVYLYAPLASHVVGYMGAITKENLDTYLAQGYKRNERVGQFGVELSLERELHGRWGKKVFEVDASGSIVRELVEQRVEPVAGFDVQLSIDLDYQQYAEQALETELRSRRDLPFEPTGDHAPRNPLDPLTQLKTRVFYQTLPDGTKVDYPEYVNHKAPAGSVVVLDNTTGQVVAMASYPTFDNRWMEAGISGTKYKQLFPSTNPDGSKIDPDQSILVNRAVQGNYNLGSTIKPFVAWAGMHAGLIDANYVYDDKGTYTLSQIPPEDCQNNGGNYKCVFKNAVCGNGAPCKYGPVNVESALAVSSDSFFYRLGELFFYASEDLPKGDPNLLKVNLQRFGFGAKTGVQLPYEWAGRIPDDAVKAALVEAGVLAPGEVPRLLVGDEVQVAIGQGLMAATPLQIAVAYSTLATDGFRQQPTVVKAIYAPLTPDISPGVADLSQGTVVKSYDTPVIVDQLEDNGSLDAITRGLRRVITGPGVDSDIYHKTTGESLFKGFPLDIAGKTGTAQGAANLPWNDSSAFGAYGLTDDVPYTVVAYLEKSGYGAKAAAPVTKCMFQALTDPTMLTPVLVSDTLDVQSTEPAPSNLLANATCLARVADGQKG